jgi:hypothetical protein
MITVVSDKHLVCQGFETWMYTQLLPSFTAHQPSNWELKPFRPGRLCQVTLRSDEAATVLLKYLGRFPIPISSDRHAAFVRAINQSPRKITSQVSVRRDYNNVTVEIRSKMQEHRKRWEIDGQRSSHCRDASEDLTTGKLNATVGNMEKTNNHISKIYQHFPIHSIHRRN